MAFGIVNVPGVPASNVSGQELEAVWSAANAAKSAAATAQSTANTANTAAGNAQSTAGSAYAKANSAYTLADAANTAAGTAQSTAGSAYAKANSAYALADAANTAAGTAQSTAESAYAKANSAYELADTANNAAKNAMSRLNAQSLRVGDGSKANMAQAVAIGVFANADTGQSIAFGFNANVTGNNSIAIGSKAKATEYDSIALGPCSSVTGKESVALGEAAATANAKSIQLGNASGLSSITAKVAITVTSDERDKADVTDIADGATEFLKKVRAVTYVYNQREMYRPAEPELDEDGSPVFQDGVDYLTDEDRESLSKYGFCRYDREAHAAGTRKGVRQRVGVLAQQVQQALADTFGSASYANLVNDNLFDYETVPEGVESTLAMNYEGFIPFLIKAFQELEGRVAKLEAANA